MGAAEQMGIIAKDYTGLVKALLNAGLADFASIKWIRQPSRINGVWRAEVEL